jgi:hypothetical protein
MPLVTERRETRRAKNRYFPEWRLARRWRLERQAAMLQAVDICPSHRVPFNHRLSLDEMDAPAALLRADRDHLC